MHSLATRTLIFAALALLSLTACDDADSGTPSDTSPADTAPGDTGTSETTTPDDTTADDVGDADTDTGPQADTALADDTQADADDADAEPPAPLLDLYALEGDDLFPESVAFDPVTRAFFVGSLEHGNVHRIEGDGSGQRVLFEGYTDQPDWLTLGVETDPVRRRLWVCATYGTTMINPTVWVLDLDSGELLREIQLQSIAPGSACNDFTIDADGLAYVTDREGPRILRVDADKTADAAEVWATDPLLEPETFGLNGIALTPDGQTLLAVKYNPPRLIRIPVADPTDVAEVALDVDLSEVTSGLDGMIMFDDGRLYATFEVEVVRFTAGDASWDTATVERVTIEQDGQPVTGWAGITAAEGVLYLLKGEVVRFALGAAPELPFRLLRFDPAAFDAAP